MKPTKSLAKYFEKGLMSLSHLASDTHLVAEWRQCREWLGPMESEIAYEGNSQSKYKLQASTEGHL